MVADDPRGYEKDVDEFIAMARSRQAELLELSADLYREETRNAMFLPYSQITRRNDIAHPTSGLVGGGRLIVKEDTCGPPRLAQFVLLLVPISQREHVIGDLEEEFRTIVVPKYGPRLAHLYYRWQVLVEVTKAISNGLKGVVFGWLFSKFTT